MQRVSPLKYHMYNKSLLSPVYQLQQQAPKPVGIQCQREVNTGGRGSGVVVKRLKAYMPNWVCGTFGAQGKVKGDKNF